MTGKDFDKLVDKYLDQCSLLLKSKAAEYATDGDRLHNFKKAGRMKDEDPVESLDGMWLKHRVSIQDMIDKMAEEPMYCPSEKLVFEKLGDNINYTLLLAGLIEDRRAELYVPEEEEAYITMRL